VVRLNAAWDAVRRSDPGANAPVAIVFDTLVDHA
jgi:hypothetical protein